MYERERGGRGGGRKQILILIFWPVSMRDMSLDVISYSIQSAAHPLLAQCATWLA